MAAANKGQTCSANRKITDEVMISEFPKIGAAGMREKYGMSEKGIYDRRRAIEDRHGLKLAPPTRGGDVQQLDPHPAAIKLCISHR